MNHQKQEPDSSERQDSDYDGAWKEAIRSHLQEFIEQCFPPLGELIDWSCEPEWLDKEISQIVGKSGRRNQEVDLLFKIRLLDGREQCIYCHLEIQSFYESNFSFRIDLYNSALQWHFQQEVLTLVILGDLNRDWRPSEHRFELGGFGTSIRFPVCKLLELVERSGPDDPSLVTQVSRAHLEALRTSGDPLARFTIKTRIIRNLYKLGHKSDKIRELFRLIDWMMHLRPDLDRKFKTELIAYEQELEMPYVTSIERIAKEEGREEGREEGLELGREAESAALLLLMLRRLWGTLPSELEQGVMSLSLDQKRSLGESLLDFKSLEDLKKWLDSANL